MSADIYTASSRRPLQLRMRADLTAHPLQFGGLEYWGLKDPVSLRYFQFQEEEYYILRRLDGATSAAEIIAGFEQRFTPQKLEAQELSAFTASLHEQGLVIANATGQAEPLLERRSKQRRQDWLERAAGILAMRFKGVDPDAFLNWLYPHVSWMFTRVVFAAMLLLIASALLMAGTQFEVLRSRLPALQDFFTPQNILLLGVTLACVKVLHEMGHALLCKHFGGECHEFGAMLLVFTPCLYVNVTDAWMIRSKWARAAIGAGGIYVELVLASICTYLWWFSEPGLLNTLCLNVMVVCSVTTLIFNGNPLLRHDGYFIVADIVEMPNLWQQASSVVHMYLSRWVLGIEPESDRLLPRRHHLPLAAYYIAALIYRVFVLVMIIWLLQQVLKPYGAQAAVHLIALVSLAGMTGPAVYRGAKFLRHPSRSRKVKWIRFWSVVILAAALLSGVAMIPLPFRVPAPVVMEPAGAARVFVPHAGVLVSGVEYQSRVKRGDVLAQLVDLQLERDVASLEGKLREQEIAVAQLYKRRVVEESGPASRPAADAGIRAAEKKAAAMRNSLAALKVRQKKLTIVAPTAGVVLVPEEVKQPQHELELASWSGAPLDPENRGALLQPQTMLCSIGDPQQQQAILAVAQSDVVNVAVGQRVAVRLDPPHGEPLWGVVSLISEIDMKDPPPHLIATGATPVKQNAAGKTELLEVMYQVRVALAPHTFPVTLRAIGQGRIYTKPRPIAVLFYNYLSRTFTFDF